MSNEFSTDLLDLLVDGPSHVMGLYFGLVKHVRFPVPVPIAPVLDAVRELDDRGLVRLWFDRPGAPEAASKPRRELALERYAAELEYADPDAVHDEIGLWCEITESGRECWREAGYSEELEGVRWTLDQDQNRLAVRAETKGAAERVLEWWLDRNPEARPAVGVEVRPISGFSLRDGAVVEGGCELTCTIGVRSP